VAQASTALARLSAISSAEPTVAPTTRPSSHGRQDLEAEEGNMLTRRAIVALAGLLAVAGLAQASVARRHDLMNGLKSLGFHSGAADWPSRPITMVVPFAAGGPTDVVGRIMAQRLGDILKQPVAVENIGGAGGMAGAQKIAQANPDGYQVLLGTVGTQAYNQTLYKKPLYSATDDFEPVALIAEQPLVLVVNKDFPAHTLAEFIAYTKANAAKLSFGSGGVGSSTHLGCVLLNSAIGVDVQHVPYKGSQPALQDLIAGRISYLCDAVSTELSQIKAGTVKPIAVLSAHRSAVLPDVPTAQEQGLPKFEANNWIGLFVPRHTPEPVIIRLHDATIEAMNTPSVRAAMEKIGTDLVSEDRTSPAYLKGFVVSEIKKWAVPIKESGVSVE
jgi:tripartite-type tricarboxylate transporter receptor subunit TctC